MVIWMKKGSGDLIDNFKKIFFGDPDEEKYSLRTQLRTSVYIGHLIVVTSKIC
jgi:hypothetical protein